MTMNGIHRAVMQCDHRGVAMYSKLQCICTYVPAGCGGTGRRPHDIHRVQYWQGAMDDKLHLGAETTKKASLVDLRSGPHNGVHTVQATSFSPSLT
jgi:hypothetical protein